MNLKGKKGSAMPRTQAAFLWSWSKDFAKNQPLSKPVGREKPPPKGRCESSSPRVLPSPALATHLLLPQLIRIRFSVTHNSNLLRDVTSGETDKMKLWFYPMCQCKRYLGVHFYPKITSVWYLPRSVKRRSTPTPQSVLPISNVRCSFSGIGCSQGNRHSLPDFLCYWFVGF